MTNKEKFSTDNICKQLIKKIEKAFGANHKIKVALFKAISEYNDEYDNYSPILILIDSDYQEIEHDINVYDLCPNDEEQYDEGTDDSLQVEDITINF